MGENVTSDKEGGNFVYNKETKEFDTNINEGGDFNKMEKLSHELKHADQYMDKKIGFDLTISNSKLALPFAYDRQDEYEAFDRQGEIGNTWTREVVDMKYKNLGLFSVNLQVLDQDKDEKIRINNGYYNVGKNPRFLYNGWKNDLKK